MKQNFPLVRFQASANWWMYYFTEGRGRDLLMFVDGGEASYEQVWRVGNIPTNREERLFRAFCGNKILE